MVREGGLSFVALNELIETGPSIEEGTLRVPRLSHG